MKAPTSERLEFDDAGFITEWSRELARGKIRFAAGLTLPFDASVADADDFLVGDRVHVRRTEGRVTAVRPMRPQHGGDSALLDVRLAPAGVFCLEKALTGEQVQRLGANLAAYGHVASIDVYPLFVSMTGWQTALEQGAAWRAFEERLAVTLDGMFDYAAVMRSIHEGLLGDSGRVEATVLGLQRLGVPQRPVARLFAVKATRLMAWGEVPPDRETRFWDAFPTLPGWVGWRDGFAHWFSGPLAWPYLWFKRTTDGIDLNGVLSIEQWRSWLAGFETLLDSAK
jgi:hypothetical protein